MKKYRSLSLSVIVAFHYLVFERESLSLSLKYEMKNRFENEIMNSDFSQASFLFMLLVGFEL